MILIADSGSTKTAWCALSASGEALYFHTEGYNPFFIDQDYMVRSLKAALPAALYAREISTVYFYGAGCFPWKKTIISGALSRVLAPGKIEVEIDLLASARALLGNNVGFAAILGTGTNTCLYDGKKIVQNINSMGYILGDEGSGTAMGKKLLVDYIRGFTPASVRDAFESTFPLNKERIMQRIYHKPLANRFCASFCKFIKAHIREAYMQDIVTRSFQSLFENLVIQYPDYSAYSFNCVGSVAFHFREILETVAADYYMNTGNIMEKPIDGLVHYHKPEFIK